MILLVMTDGRVDCLSRAIESARENLCGEVTHKVIHDDTGDESYREELRATFPDFDVIGQPTRQGFGGAIRSAWAALSGRPERFVFHLEDDFTFNAPIDLPPMQHVLDRCLAKDPAARYPQVAELLADLRAIRLRLEASDARPAAAARDSTGPLTCRIERPPAP